MSRILVYHCEQSQSKDIVLNVLQNCSFAAAAFLSLNLLANVMFSRLYTISGFCEKCRLISGFVVIVFHFVGSDFSKQLQILARET